jgi:hypothetical protein
MWQVQYPPLGMEIVHFEKGESIMLACKFA